MFACFDVFLPFLFSDDGRLHGATARKRMEKPTIFFGLSWNTSRAPADGGKKVGFLGEFSREGAKRVFSKW